MLGVGGHPSRQRASPTFKVRSNALIEKFCANDVFGTITISIDHDQKHQAATCLRSQRSQLHNLAPDKTGCGKTCGRETFVVYRCSGMLWKRAQQVVMESNAGATMGP